jgi:hypothetical protein
MVFWKSLSLNRLHRPLASRPDRPLPLWASVLIILTVSGLLWWLLARLIFWFLAM